MRIVKSVSGMQKLARRWKEKGRRISFVPTMGYLHQGHFSLVKKARQLARPEGAVVVSIYVNPTQFGPSEDFSKYPRDFARDTRACREAGVDVVFAPTDQEMYPGREDGHYSTYVVEESLSRTMEGASRPTHFRGVTTVVAKLFNAVLPDSAVFGAKDYQQAAVIQRMVKDLNFPLRIVVAPTLREKDGLAMSSRNKYLEGGLREEALVLWKSLQAIQTKVASTRSGISAGKLKQMVEDIIGAAPHARLDYVEFFDPATLELASVVKSGSHMALAVFVGKTRLIDNSRLA